MIVGHIGGAGSPYEIQKSLRFRASASAYLSWTPSVAGNRKTWTWSGWVKRGAVNTDQTLLSNEMVANAGEYIFFTAAGTLQVGLYSGTPTTATLYRETSAVFRDPSAHYHFLVTVDTPNATAQNRLRVYVNGVEITSWAVNTAVPQNLATFFNTTNRHGTGALTVTNLLGQLPLDGYLSEINFIDGQALDPSYFGEVSAETGAWIPKKYTGTYGTNGFYLPFTDGSSLANLTADRSGNGNNWAANNISLTAGVTYDWMDDTPANNFAVLNPLEVVSSSNKQITEGNLKNQSGVAAVSTGFSTISLPDSGSFYFELTQTSYNATGNQIRLGIMTLNGTLEYVRTSESNNGIILNNVLVAGFVGADGDVYGFACNVSTGVVQVYRNGALVYTSGTLSIAGQKVVVQCSGTNIAHANFGQRPFTYTPPAGFKALCTKNLPAPSILNPKKHFDVKTRAGTGSGATISGIQFAPDLVWIKARGAAYSNNITDKVRGATKTLISNAAVAEEGNRTVGYVSAFTSDGYSLAAGSSSIVEVAGATTYVDWLWKAGGAPVTNNAGSIQSQVSANPQAGFSIVTYTGNSSTGQTIGHGLGVTPKMIIVKRRDTVSNWPVWHSGLTPTTGCLFLDLTSEQTAFPNRFASTGMTSTVFKTGSHAVPNEVNGSGGTFVAYCFSEIPGYSKIGSYVGNGSADGPFVYCGFRPRYVLIKRVDATGQWRVVDTARASFNQSFYDLYPNLSNAEGAVNFDALSNGFKQRTTYADYNASGATYIFAAFAEQPFQFANAR